MFNVIFSSTKLCPDVAKVAVANLIKIFAYSWAWVILFPTHIGMWRDRDERQSNELSKESARLCYYIL